MTKDQLWSLNVAQSVDNIQFTKEMEKKTKAAEPLNLLPLAEPLGFDWLPFLASDPEIGEP